MATFRWQARIDGAWIDIDGGSVVDNDQLAIRVVFATPTTTDGIRLLVENPGKENRARVREIRLWTDRITDLAPLATSLKANFHPRCLATVIGSFSIRAGSMKNGPSGSRHR